MEKYIEFKENFRTLAFEHGLATLNGDHKMANKIHDKLHDIYKTTMEENRMDIFVDFLGNENEDEKVKLWAATFSLKVAPKLAEMELENLSNTKSIIGLNAKVTLKMWKSGSLELL